ncbi:uncharacterized protein LOC128957694 [Oppia nitens]|uniref:uncharacterized protein LOC128957694 n=1 Tax=Oppia nitens TaxID=1686743 RepID=UPI0023DA1CF8|nr:uncharacterized protein LOC128957694 [Oppia nitens]
MTEIIYKLSYIITGIIWLSISLLSLVVYFLFPPDIYYWDKVCDKCTTRTAKYRYVIRFIFGNFKPNFLIDKTTVTVEVCDSNRSLIVLQIPPKQLENSIQKGENSSLRVCRFLLYRKEPLADIKNVTVNHNGEGTINVTIIEIQELSSPEANIAYVGSAITNMAKAKDFNAHSHPAATREQRPLEAELSPSQTLTALEYIILFFVSINQILLQTVFLIPCKTGLCKDYSDGFFAALFSGLTACSCAALGLIIMCLFYRCCIKRTLYNKKAKGCCVYCRYLFLTLCIVVGIALGGGAAYLTSDKHYFAKQDSNSKDSDHEIFWLISVGLGIAVYFLFWVPILSIVAYLFSFFSDPLDQTVTPKDTQAEAPAGPAPSNDGQDYYAQLTKGDQKVKSISQYKGPQASKGPSKTRIAAKPVSKKLGKTKSTESIGENYYKQLMGKEAKVKSVSQYPGVKK